MIDFTRSFHYLNQPQELIILGNIPWDIDIIDVLHFLSPVVHIRREWVHIIIDRMTGKTKPDIIVEIPDLYCGYRCVTQLNNTIIKGRLISVRLAGNSCIEEFIFPDSTGGSYLNRIEVNHLLEICHNYKNREAFPVHFINVQICSVAYCEQGVTYAIFRFILRCH
jgi:RNA recognition motif-containing protein